MWLDIKIHKEARFYQPYLNGVKLDDCFAANEEEGWADCYKKNSEGHHFLNDDKIDVVRERVFGKVELKRKKSDGTNEN